MSERDELSYEAARAELREVVGKLESGGQSLEESLALWERGEELADICQRWLDAAAARLDTKIAEHDAAGAAGGNGGGAQPPAAPHP
jgi:exodeoxyribonuclease VII small subunit